jgi:hypothetical protein
VAQLFLHQALNGFLDEIFELRGEKIGHMRSLPRLPIAAMAQHVRGEGVQRVFPLVRFFGDYVINLAEHIAHGDPRQRSAVALVRQFGFHVDVMAGRIVHACCHRKTPS